MTEPTEEELRAAYEEQLKQIRIEDIVIENVVTLVNLGMRRTGLAPGTEGERDPDQVRLAIESVRALLPLLEQAMPREASQVRGALSQLQLAYVKIGEAAASSARAGEPAGGEAGEQPATTGSASAGAGGPGRHPDQGDAPGPGSARPGEASAKPGEPGPAQRSGRLWVPGQ